jgi:hypothetical protein
MLHAYKHQCQAYLILDRSRTIHNHIKEVIEPIQELLDMWKYGQFCSSKDFPEVHCPVCNITPFNIVASVGRSSSTEPTRPPRPVRFRSKATAGPDQYIIFDMVYRCAGCQSSDF